MPQLTYANTCFAVTAYVGHVCTRGEPVRRRDAVARGHANERPASIPGTGQAARATEFRSGSVLRCLGDAADEKDRRLGTDRAHG